jgi:hypothetical protein
MGLRSKQGRGREGRLCSGPTLRTRGNIVSQLAKALITGGKRGREVAGPTCIVVYL